ncbi:hypothetical protein GWK47_010626 [Chionoecetes opilio]|uniref:Uncharacterized protein n=1 Tax=Chionoecetes opilio TaxID=41210 RepID=A0A8J4XYF1_CHIOP|nr:hypothetical protein GWK47_010626 [Chionoecetes opilio]
MEPQWCSTTCKKEDGRPLVYCLPISPRTCLKKAFLVFGVSSGPRSPLLSLQGYWFTSTSGKKTLPPAKIAETLVPRGTISLKGLKRRFRQSTPRDDYGKLAERDPFPRGLSQRPRSKPGAFHRARGWRVSLRLKMILFREQLTGVSTSCEVQIAVPPTSANVLDSQKEPFHYHDEIIRKAAYHSSRHFWYFSEDLIGPSCSTQSPCPTNKQLFSGALFYDEGAQEPPKRINLPSSQVPRQHALLRRKNSPRFRSLVIKTDFPPPTPGNGRKRNRTSRLPPKRDCVVNDTPSEGGGAHQSFNLPATQKKGTAPVPLPKLWRPPPSTARTRRFPSPAKPATRVGWLP